MSSSKPDDVLGGINDILFLCYGNSIEEDSEYKVELMIRIIGQNDGEMPKKELAEEVGYDLDDDNERRKFDYLLSGLKGEKLDKAPQIVDTDAEGTTTVYFTKHRAMRQLNNMKDRVRYIFSEDAFYARGIEALRKKLDL